MAFNGQETKKTVRQHIKEHSPCTHTRNFYEWITNEIEQDSRLLLHSSLCVSCFSVGCLHFRFFFLHINKASVRAAHSPQKDINSEKMTAEKRHNENSNHMWLQFLCVISLVANVFFLILSHSFDYITRRTSFRCATHAKTKFICFSFLNAKIFIFRPLYFRWKENHARKYGSLQRERERKRRNNKTEAKQVIWMLAVR